MDKVFMKCEGQQCDGSVASTFNVFTTHIYTEGKITSYRNKIIYSVSTILLCSRENSLQNFEVYDFV